MADACYDLVIAGSGAGGPSPSIIRGGPLEEEPGLGALTLPGFLAEVTARHGAREALVMHQGDGAVIRWRYAELWDRAMAVARALMATGIGKGSRVGILMTNRPEWLSATFGAWLAGATAVPLSTFSTLPELAYLLEVSCLSTLLFESRVLKKDFGAMLTGLEPAIRSAEPGRLHSLRFPFLRRLATVDGSGNGGIQSWEQFLGLGEAVAPALVEAAAHTVKPAETAALFFSSGSTARPKGILSTHRGLAVQFWRWARIFGLEGDVRSWTPNGFFWSGNCASVMGCTLAAGGTLVLQRGFVPTEALALMEAERVNFPMVWPHQAKLLVEAPNWRDVDLSAMRFVSRMNAMSAHPTIPSTGWAEPRWSYGSTETFTITAAFPSGTPETIAGDSHGAALPGNIIKIIDPATGAVLPRGERGEIAVKGPTLMLGYLGVPAEETFDGDGFYRSGDSGYIDAQDRLHFEGRLTTVIKTGGANVSPIEIDEVLERFPGVKAARAVGVPHEALGEIVVGCIVPAQDATIDGAALLAFARDRLASYKVPRRLIFLREDELELTGSAKIKPAELRKLAIARVAAEQARECGQTKEMAT